MMPRGAGMAAIAVAAFLLAPFASAQSIEDLSSAGAPPPITLSLSAQYPQPYSSVMLSVQSTALDLADATLSVAVDGTNVYKGNVQPVSVTIGGAGVGTVINATVVSQGQSYPASLTVDPGDVSLVEEPIASTPPLYLGKPLVPLSGEVRLVAVAGFRSSSGAAIDPSTLSYTWMQDGSTLSGSGIGKNVLIVDAPLQYRASDVSVTVQTQDGTEAGSGTVSLAPQDPTVRIYENDPLLGVLFDHALSGTFPITGTEVSFYGAAYSFSTTDGAPAIAWFLNGAAAGTASTITLRPTGSGAGESSVSLSASEPGNYESASADLSVSYGASSGNGLFGL